ncbi:hypothetical protein D3C75_1088620 [compost metagenome]
MKGVQMPGQGFDMLQRHGDHAGVAIACGDTIDHPFLVQQGVEKARTTGNGLAVVRVTLQPCGSLAVGQGQHVLDAKCGSAEGYRLKRIRCHRSSRMGRN